MILSQREQAPLTVMRIVEILEDVLPKDVVMAVPGLGSEAPQMLVMHPNVRAVSFRGSAKGGRYCVEERGTGNHTADLSSGERTVLSCLTMRIWNVRWRCTRRCVLEMLSKGFEKLVAEDGMGAGTHVVLQVHKALQQ